MDLHLILYPAAYLPQTTPWGGLGVHFLPPSSIPLPFSAAFAVTVYAFVTPTRWRRRRRHLRRDAPHARRCFGRALFATHTFTFAGYGPYPHAFTGATHVAPHVCAVLTRALVPLARATLSGRGHGVCRRPGDGGGLNRVGVTSPNALQNIFIQSIYAVLSWLRGGVFSVNNVFRPRHLSLAADTRHGRRHAQRSRLAAHIAGGRLPHDWSGGLLGGRGPLSGPSAQCHCTGPDVFIDCPVVGPAGAQCD